LFRTHGRDCTFCYCLGYLILLSICILAFSLQNSGPDIIITQTCNSSLNIYRVPFFLLSGKTRACSFSWKKVSYVVVMCTVFLLDLTGVLDN
jgi:hypothetical protein